MTTPVVLVPGLGLGPESYAPTVEYLDTQYEVVTLPGYGERAPRGVDLSTSALAERLVVRIKESPAVLVGHSASCQIVVAAAIAHPELAKALVLVGPSGDRNTAGWATLAARWTASAIWDPPRLVPTLARQYFRTGFPSMARAIAAAQHYDMAAALSELRAPIIVVRSKHDRLAPPQWVQQVADEAHGEAWTLPSGSHLPVLTNGRELAAYIRRCSQGE
ncbi:pimeloyl-ACP methyl ester carboxylesterase [Kribbella voronezhensis]|uniref:Pimeloyl-ACP methyl ester carboxylesterase n=1 Tax=Kribbella voronezhensis TaxID=2512212 RepID=A0A4R7TD35_9ACTN|nr:alpha/beta hydrolase [Kribbella voronezhensis]TDU89669.1 pimeloyl-ACP methyl ester carboxylesterase [Kribbella voronezhensis]